MRIRMGRAAAIAPLLVALVVMAAKCPGRKSVKAPAVAKSSAIPDSADQVAFGFRTVLTNQGVANGLPAQRHGNRL